MFRICAALTLLVFFLTALGFAATGNSGQFKITPVFVGLEQPWSIGFLPDNTILITERDQGKLLRLVDGRPHQVTGVARVYSDGQGGLLDILVPRDFTQTRQLYFTYSKPQGEEAGTAVATAVLSDDNQRLIGWTDIFVMTPGSTGAVHFGGRIVEGFDGFLYVTIGERGDRPSAQDLSRENGSVIRIARDGSVPVDNPFLQNSDAQPEIWSYGHRNAQGAALGTDGQIWVAEHGAKGGDEINLIRKGANYGWPIISYGQHYSGKDIGEGTHKQGMEQPAFYWDPSMAPSGMMIYSGKLWPEWAGDIFVGSLKFDYIARLSGTPLSEVEQLKSSETERVRDIREAPDGSIWFLSIGQGTLYKITP